VSFVRCNPENRHPTKRGPGCSRQAIPLWTALLLLPLGLASPALAQEGSVGGVVLSAETRAPLPDAQIEIVGTGRSVISRTNGRFLLLNVPGQQVTLRVTLLGYRTLERIVRVGDRNLELVLEPTALELDAVVVTGTAGAQRVRALGNAVGRVEASVLQEITAPANVRELIGARVPGVNLVNAEGAIGSGSPTAIRGVGSLSLSHEPLYYVDGIRVDSDPSDTGVGDNYGNGANRINDLNPEDIESIEIIKGPAATTLYGTEASNGVIHIITKRGRNQAPQWDFRLEQGVSYLPNPEKLFPEVWAREDDQLISMNIVRNERENGPGPVFRTGRNQAYGMSVRGGTDDVRYYLSGDWARREGVVDYNWQNKLNLRSNLTFVLGEQLDLQFNLGTVRMRTETSGPQPITTGIIWGSPLLRNTGSRGFITPPPEAYHQYENIEQYDRLTYSVQLQHRPVSWLNHRLTVGGDYGFRRGHTLVERTPDQPGPWGADSQGAKDVGETRNTLATVDYAATAGFDVTPDIRLETTVGGTFTRRQEEESTASGDIFPVPGLETVSSATQRTATEDYVEERTLGAFFQQQIGYKNRFFLTAGVRGDDHSAFGKNFDFVVYPKLMVSWVAGEESFLRDLDFLSTLKLRAAWGQAGQQPSTFAAVRLYSPSSGPGGAPTVTPSNIGNPDLEPEKGEELEIGFDASFFDDRLGLEFTWYGQRTKQALIEAPVKPSRGFPGTQMLNIGEVSNRGIEVALNATPIRRENVSWNLTFSLGTNENEIVSLGGIDIPPSSFSTEQVEGFPINSIFMLRVVNAKYDPSGELVDVMCDGGRGRAGREPGGEPVPCSAAPTVYWGSPIPTWQGSVSTTLTLWGNVRLYALADFRGGHTYVNGDVAASHVFFTNSRCINERPICDPELAAYASMGQWMQTGTMDNGFAKLRTVSASYTLPSSMTSRFGASRATLTLAAQNLFRLWTASEGKYGHKVIDPEVGKHTTVLDTYNQEGWPHFRTITTSLRISF
jgi:TonB-linked SusC/RagA family outer membrane protein